MIDRFDAMHTYNLCLKVSMNQRIKEKKDEKKNSTVPYFSPV